MKRKRVEQAWRSRRLSLLGCAAARSFANLASGSDRPIPSSHEVEVTGYDLLRPALIHTKNKTPNLNPKP